MKIRTITDADINNTAHLFDQYRVFYHKKSSLEEAINFLSDRYSNNDSRIYVCEDTNGDLLGFVQLYPLFSSTRMKKYWLLNDLFVNEHHRGKGIAIKLIERAKKLVRDSNACGMYLETDKTNMVGNNLYPKSGFKLYEHANFYEWTAEV